MKQEGFIGYMNNPMRVYQCCVIILFINCMCVSSVALCNYVINVKFSVIFSVLFISNQIKKRADRVLANNAHDIAFWLMERMRAMQSLSVTRQWCPYAHIPGVLTPIFKDFHFFTNQDLKFLFLLSFLRRNSYIEC